MQERFTGRARVVIQLALQEALRLGHEYIDTEHILLGIIKEGKGIGAMVLNGLGVDIRKVRLETEKLILTKPDSDQPTIVDAKP